SRRRAGSVRKVRLLPVVAGPVGQRRIRCVVQPRVPFRRDGGRIREDWIDHPAANARSTKAGVAFGEIAVAYRVGADLSSLEVGEDPGPKVHVPFLHKGCVKYSAGAKTARFIYVKTVVYRMDWFRRHDELLTGPPISRAGAHAPPKECRRLFLLIV